MKRQYYLQIFAIFWAVTLFINYASAEVHSMGWQCPAGSCSREATSNDGGWHGYIGKDSNGNDTGYHVGIDYMRSYDSPVYAIANGVIEDYGSSLAYYGSQCGAVGGAILVRHTAKGQDGYTRNFWAVYGHMYKTSSLKIGDIVEKGEVVGNLHHYYGPGPSACNQHWEHLHFGLHPDSAPTGQNRFRGVASSTSSDEGWTHPMNFLDANFPASYDVDCGKLAVKYPDIFREKGIYNCQNAVYVYPNQYVVWHYVQESMTGYWGTKTAWFQVSANEGVIASSDKIPSGIAFGGGPGMETVATDAETLSRPDFIVKKVSLISPITQAEAYIYGRNESIIIDSYSKNIGQANWAGNSENMQVRFYLSKGYKEDAHSEWRRIGIEYIKKGNIDVGVTKRETHTFDLATGSVGGGHLGAGIYNFVVCVDRNQDIDNDDGDVPEMHRSNNCSTEAVFEVKDVSQVNFWTYNPTIVVTNPTSTDKWRSDNTKHITWQISDFPTPGNVKIEYSMDGGVSWRTITSSAYNDGSSYWDMCNYKTVDSSKSYIRITSLLYPSAVGISQKFTIDHAKKCK